MENINSMNYMITGRTVEGKYSQNYNIGVDVKHF